MNCRVKDIVAHLVYRWLKKFCSPMIHRHFQSWSTVMYHLGWNILHRYDLIIGRFHSLNYFAVDDLIVLTETVACELTHGNYDRCLQNNVALMYQNLKLYGPQLDSIYKELLDRFFVVFRNGSQDDNLDKRSRLHLLELIELRAKQWEETDHMSHYYKHRVTHTEVCHFHLY